MGCVVERAGSVARISVDGALDVYAVPELRSCLQKAVSAGARRVVVDLEDVEFLDSSALGVFVAAHRRVAALGGSIGMENLSSTVRETFDVTGLSATFGIEG